VFVNPPRSDLAALLRTLEPVLNDDVYAYCAIPLGAELPAIEAVGVFRESEGTTIIAPETQVLAAGLPVLFRAAWITLTVNSALDAVGLTAAFSRALADAGISCNVVAAAHHDHIFVPVEQADDAMACLRALQRQAAR
jgi:uncharacterized protein